MDKFRLGWRCVERRDVEFRDVVISKNMPIVDSESGYGGSDHRKKSGRRVSEN